jgi:hypothetical protein
MKWIRAAAAAIALLNVAATQWSPDPWVADLRQARAAVQAKYANLDWLREERQVDVDALFQRGEAALRGAGSDAEARAVFERVLKRLGDGHVSIRWRRGAGGASVETPPAPPRDIAAFCRARGYRDAARPSPLAALPGFQPLPPGPFPSGIVSVGESRIGIVRIDIFDPHGDPSACAAAVTALREPIDKPCDADCDNRILTEAYRRFSAAFAERILALEAAGARILLVDVSGNGGGSEWAEVAARMVSGRSLRSARLAFMRGAHWHKLWADLAGRLREFAGEARGAERAELLRRAAEADAAAVEAARECPDASCPRLAQAGYATGLIGASPAGTLADKPWGVHLFSPAQHQYRDGVWTGPLIVLTDDETWSAAEQFAALLQDNKAAVIVGGRTGGAGCGHTWGGTPTELANSKAVLELPDCVRLRADGSNEVRGILPDVTVPIRASDGAALKARLVGERLHEAIARAQALR